MCFLTGTADDRTHFKVWNHWSKSLWFKFIPIPDSLESRDLKDEGKQCLSQADILFSSQVQCRGVRRALPSPLPAPPGQDPKAAGPKEPRNATAADAQVTTPFPQPAVLIYSTGPRSTRKAASGHRPHGFHSGRHRAGEKTSDPAPWPWAPRAWALGPRPSPSTPSRSGRRQSSRPPPLPPAIQESWQRRGQRREGERRRPPCELQPADRAAPTAPASEQGPSCHGFLSRSGLVSFRILLVGHSARTARTGKVGGGLFSRNT